MVSSGSLTEAFRPLVFFGVLLPPQIDLVNKVLYHLPNTISLKTGLSAARYYLHLFCLKERNKRFGNLANMEDVDFYFFFYIP